MHLPPCLHCVSQTCFPADGTRDVSVHAKEILLSGVQETEEEAEDIAVAGQSQADDDHLLDVTTHSQGHSCGRSLQQFWALCVVRILILMRSKSLIWPRVAMPAGCIVIGVLLGSLTPRNKGKNTIIEPNALKLGRFLNNPDMTVTLSGHGE